ncbi:hypothetical protein JFV29_15020 [Peribacillus sp. TH16]|uniref:hypothetical protein n=1 Tax=Peribacillus sp. TH16 TaxID=2798482 RepID=UPI0019125C21|nr:hypothetical protein [Peribacillus sp. TH16]MBK5483174.1 hypothetical protein [Peribacillus sp. TH16]
MLEHEPPGMKIKRKRKVSLFHSWWFDVNACKKDDKKRQEGREEIFFRIKKTEQWRNSIGLFIDY